MNIYANNKEDAREGVAALGNNPSRQDVERAFDHAIRDLNDFLRPRHVRAIPEGISGELNGTPTWASQASHALPFV